MRAKTREAADVKRRREKGSLANFHLDKALKVVFCLKPSKSKWLRRRFAVKMEEGRAVIGL